MSVGETTPGPPVAIDRYQVRELLGEGAFGAVYRAFDPRLERDVALKVLRPERMTSAQAVERFLREAKAAAQLLHPHIVPVHDAGRAGDFYYIASAFIRGKTLAAAVPAEGMAPRQAAGLAAQLASALGYAHRRGVVHRDVKPQNVLLDEQGSLHLTDFGLAGWVEEENTRLTQEGAVLGTPLYMAPEQATGDTASVGPASDLYSAGVVLFELLAGRPPFTARTASALAYQIVHTTPPPPSQLRPGLDAGLEAICLKALAKRPEDRFGSGEEMAEALAGWAASAPKTEACRSSDAPPSCDRATVDYRPARPGSATLSTAPPVSGRDRRGRSVLRWALGGGAVLVLLAGLAIAGMASLFHPPPSSSAGDIPAAPTGPPRAVAPFDAAEAKRLQQAWAAHLGRKVEEEDEIAPGVKMKFVLIPPGTFLMGSPEGETDRSREEVQHKVELTHAFYLGVYDVTRGQFRQFVEATKYQTEAESDGKGGYGLDTKKNTWVQDPKYTWRSPGFSQTDDDPVVEVSGNDAVKYIEWLNGNAKDGLVYRLPTEAEWEYCCRGGRTSPLPFGIGDGASLSSRDANFAGAFPYGGAAKGPYLQKTTPGGTYSANALGLYDMQGNVWQWCADWYGSYPTGEAIDPTGPSSGSSRVFRGGCWYNFARDCRAASRGRDEPGSRSGCLGFRLARVPSGLGK